MLVTYATYLSLRAIKCYSVVFGVMLKLAVVNILPSFPAINNTAAYYQRSVTTYGSVVRPRRIYNTWLVAALTVCTEARYWLRIVISAYPTCIRRPRQNIAMPFGTEKLEWCGYPAVKICEDMFIRFDRVYERDRETDRHRMMT